MTGGAAKPIGKAPAVLIMAGGTGGHVYPALAVAERLRPAGVTVTWLGTRRGLESTVVPEAGIPLDQISVAGLRGKQLSSLMMAPAKLLRALQQSLTILRRRRPDVVLGMGGFVSGPGGVAAWLTRRPLLIHEQNAIPGLTNRLLARLARRVMEAFPGSFPASVGARCTGNPVREAVAATLSPDERLLGRRGPLRLLVLGGSQGARALNEVVHATLASLAGEVDLEVWHQAGTRHLEQTLAWYAERGVHGRVVDYIQEMAEAYDWADLVLCRAGAMTIAELTAAGVGSILVPFPFAVDDHQTQNARFLSEQGAAILVPETELTTRRLGGLLRELAGARDRLLEMAHRARALARPRSAQAVADMCLEVANA